MKLSKLLNSIEHPLGSLIDENIEDICHDSRRAREGSLFVCIKGALSDGHEYAISAYSKGCRHFVAEHGLDMPEDANVFCVPDTRIALAQLSERFFGEPSSELYIIGITGTKGKTTTALMIYNILNACGMKCGYIGSNGVDYGRFHYETSNTTPESYSLRRYMREMLLAGVKYLAIEISSQALYLNRVYGMKMDTCIYTNLSEDHIGGAEHPTFEHYKECKKQLFTLFNPKTVIYNTDDAYAQEMISGVKKGTKLISYSINNAAELTASKLQKTRSYSFLGVAFDLKLQQKLFHAELSFPGSFSVYNALAAIACCTDIGLEISNVLNVLKNVQIKGRFETVQALPYATFIIDYAHNGVSLTSALNTLREYEPNRLICLFGSVGGRTKERRPVLGNVAARLADFSIITSDNPDFENPNSVINDIAAQFSSNDGHIKIPDRRQAIEYAVSIARKGDIILLAGKGHETYQLINGEKLPFCEKDILLLAAESLKEKV